MTSLRSKTLKTILKLSRFLSSPVTTENLAQKRQAVIKLEKYFPVSRGVVIEPVKTKTFKGEWITTLDSRPDMVMLYFHGGGFVFNSTRLYRDHISRIARAGKVKALSLDYSLAPENRFPQILAEALAAYRWLLKNYPPNHIVIAGDSAGGSLALSLLHQIKSEKLPNPVAAIVIAPATDGTMSHSSLKQKSRDIFLKAESVKFFIDSYFGPGERNDPVASPLFGNFRGFPPLLVHVDRSEILYSDSARVVEKARQAGVNVEFYEAEGLWHVWHLAARYIPEARRAIDDIGQFIRAHT